MKERKHGSTLHILHSAGNFKYVLIGEGLAAGLCAGLIAMVYPANISELRGGFCCGCGCIYPHRLDAYRVVVCFSAHTGISGCAALEGGAVDLR